MIHRRELLHTAVTVGGASILNGASAANAADAARPHRIIDTNVSLFQWPFRRLPLDTTAALVAKLRQLGIAQAWAGSFEAILHRDLTSVNQRLAAACSEHDELIPLGSINPELPGWERDLELCAGQHKMAGIRIFPNYHGYKLSDVRCVRLLQLATSHRQFVQIAAQLEDSRTQHRLVQVPPVDLSELPRLMAKCPGAMVQVLNFQPRGQILNQLASTPNVHFDLSHVDGTDGISKLLQRIPSDRLLFGSHAPFLIPEAALIRMDESGSLDAAQRSSLGWANADRLLGRTGKLRAEEQ